MLKDGKEVPPDELPMQYAAAHDVAVRDVELDVLRADGTLLNLYEYASPLYDEDGRVRGSLGVLVDITSRKNAERRLIMQYEIARILAESNSISQAATKFLKIISASIGWEFSALWRVEPDGQGLTNEGVWHADTPHSGKLTSFAETTIYSFLEDNPASLLGKVLHSGELVWTSDFIAEIPCCALDRSQPGRFTQRPGFSYSQRRQNYCHTGMLQPVEPASRPEPDRHAQCVWRSNWHLPGA